MPTSSEDCDSHRRLLCGDLLCAPEMREPRLPLAQPVHILFGLRGPGRFNKPAEKLLWRDCGVSLEIFAPTSSKSRRQVPTSSDGCAAIAAYGASPPQKTPLAGLLAELG